MNLPLLNPAPASPPVEPEPDPGEKLLELRREAVKSYRSLTGRSRPGLNHLLNLALSSTSYSQENEAKQVKRIKEAGASDEEISILRRFYEYRRDAVAPVWGYLDALSEGENPGVLVPVGNLVVDTDHARDLAAYHRAKADQYDRIAWKLKSPEDMK